MRNSTSRKGLPLLLPVLLILMVFASVPGVVNAEIFSGTGYSFDNSTGTLTVTSYAGFANWKNDMNFTSDDIIHVVVADGVNAVAANAFYFAAPINRGCLNLVSLSLPDSVTAIEDNAFRDCRALNSFDFPPALDYLGEYSFYGAGMNTVNLSNCWSLTRIENRAFAFSQVYLVRMPPLLNHIAEMAFAGSELDAINYTYNLPAFVGTDAFFDISFSGVVYYKQLLSPSAADLERVVPTGWTPLGVSASPPRITLDPMQNAYLGYYYNVRLKVDSEVPVTWNISQGSLPPGLILYENSRIVGTPTESGTYAFTLEVVGVLGGSDSKEFTITVPPAPPDDLDIQTLAVLSVMSDSATINGEVYRAYSMFEIGFIAATSLPLDYTSAEVMKLEVRQGQAGLGEFTMELTDLLPATKYYVRALFVYEGITYGDVLEFTTAGDSTVTTAPSNPAVSDSDTSTTGQTNPTTDSNTTQADLVEIPETGKEGGYSGLTGAFMVFLAYIIGSGLVLKRKLKIR